MLNTRSKKIAMYTLVFLALMVAIHALMLSNAEKIISDEVHRQTNGRFNLSIGKIKIDYWNMRIEILDSEIEVMDSAIVNQLVKIEAPYLGIHLSSFTGMIIRKDLSIDSLICDMPHITISSKKKAVKDASVSHEMGQILLSIRKTLETLEVEKLRINGGMVTLNPDKIEMHPIAFKDLNLGIDHFTPISKEDTNFLSSNYIHFQAGQQMLVSQDCLRSFSFRNIDISTKNRQVVLDSCTFRGNRDEVNYAIFFEQLRLVNLDFDRLYDANVLRTDSALCKGVNLAVQLNSNPAEKSKKTTDQVTEETMKTLTQNLELKYVRLSGSEITILNKKGDKSETYSSREHSFELIDVGMNSGLISPIQIGEIRFHLSNYKGYSNDSLFAVSFESISIINRDLLLNRFEIAPTEKYTGYLRNRATIAQLTLRNISFSAALFDRKMVTDEIIVDSPFIHVITDQRSEGEHKPILEVLNSLDKSFGIKKTTLRNATIVSEHLNEYRRLRIEGLNTIIHPTDILSASGVKDVLYAVDYAEASKVELKQSNRTFTASRVSLDNSENLNIGKIELRKGDNLSTATGIRITGINVETDNTIRLNQLTWEGAEINYFIDPPTGKSKKPQGAALPAIKINTLSLKNTVVTKLHSSDFILKGDLENFSLTSLSYDLPSGVQFSNLTSTGGNIHIQKEASILRLQKFNIQHDEKSFFKALIYTHRTPKDSTEVSIEQVNFVPDIISSLQKNFLILKRLEVFHPSLLIRMSESEQTSLPAKFPEISIDKFGVKNLSIDAIIHNKKGNLILISDKGEASIDNVRFGANGINTGSIAAQLNKVKFNYRDTVIIISEREGLSLELDQFKNEGNEKLAFKVKHAEINADHITMHNKEGDEIKVYKTSSELENAVVTYPLTREAIKNMFSHPDFSVKNTSAEFITETHILNIKQFSYSNATSTIGLKSLDYLPIMDRQAYSAIYRTQSDYMKVHLGECTLNHFNFADNLFAKKFFGGDLTVRDLNLETYKDRRLPAGPERTKKLPTVLIQNIPFPFELKSANLKNGKIEYTEISGKNGKEGIVRLSRINLKMSDIRNHHLNFKDSLNLTAEAWLMDSARLSVNFKESYLDTLSGFVLKVQANPFDLRILNSFTEALASIYIKSGYLNSLSMVAVGKEDIALGEMKFYYEDLAIDLIGNKEETERNIINSFTSMVANDFIIKKENHSRTSLVYFERLRNKSLFNYWIKITLSGVMTTVGVQQTNIYKRRYRNYLKKSKVPPVS